MNRNETWLRTEIERWQREGIIDGDVARRIGALYPGGMGRGGRNYALAAFAVLGSLLVGGGVILLLAHNWADLHRTLRTALALAPLVVAVILAAVGAARSLTSPVWREAVATLWTLSVGAAIALVSQIYHLSGSFEDFMLSWMLLALPVVYVMRSSAAAGLYVAGILSWACDTAWYDDTVLWYWPLTALIAPFLVARWRKSRHAPGTSLVLWILTASIIVGTGVSMSRALPGLWTIIYASLFSVMFLLDALFFETASSLWHRPLRVAGLLGSTVLALMFTYDWPWREVGWAYYHDEYPLWRQLVDAGFALGLTGWAVALVAPRRDLLRGVSAFAACFPLVAFTAFALSAHVGQLPAMLLLNGYVLALGLTLLAGGLRRNTLASVNGGMLLVGLLVVLRFFDSDLSLLARGLVFVALGLAFLAVNIVLARRQRRMP